MNPETRAKVEARLRYHEDLGISSLYRGRAPQTVTPQASANVQARDDAPAAAVSAAASSVKLPAARPAAPPATPATHSPLPVLQAPSLFDSVDRVEGDTLESIRGDLGECTRCRLHKQRTKIVFGAGNPKAELIFVGEGPGHDEDLQGLPFVGRAGKLLTQIIEAMGLAREDVYIANIVKCRPPENRLPEKDEIATCAPFLFRQLGAISPKVVVCLGACAAHTLLATNQSISRFRGEWFDFRGMRLLATYHPAYLLRNPAAKSEVWNDMKKVIAYLGLQPRRSPRQP